MPQASRRHFLIDVREKHDETCGGDPSVSPRVLSITVDRFLGCASYSAPGASSFARP
ncbi:hypothetical protein MTBLM1_70214 [Rhodospirillaceae bacterium LM-1]|nr:hypothetical protein MTBLM1_70214 [Rhodospirillaceae bacterium LM-1]